MSPKRGHVTAKTTLRSSEVSLVVRQTVDLEAERLRRNDRIRSGTVPGKVEDPRPWTRTGFYRAAIRFALENPNAFRSWLEFDRDTR